MERLTLRHLGGGFLGGALGILTLGLLTSWLTPVGCLFGVLIGFYPDVIFRETKKSWLASMRWLKNFRIHYPVLHLPTFRLPNFKESALYSRYRKWRNHLAEHPMNQAYCVRNWALVTYLALQATVITVAVIIIDGLSGVFQWPLGILYIFSIFCTVMGNTSEDEARHQMTRFYRRYEFYNKHGGFLFFWRQLYVYLRINLAFFVGLIAIVSCLAFFVGLFVVPFWFVVYPLKAAYHVSKRSDHWLCLAVVLIATSISTHLLRHHISGQTLWLTSLGNGILCAFLSECARRLTIFVFNRQASFAALVMLPAKRYHKVRFERSVLWLADSPIGITMRKLMVEA